VVAENQRPGDPSWVISSRGHGTILGFVDRVSAQRGQTVTLFVTADAPSFSVAAYRIGYYGGTGARKVWTSATVSGRRQPSCPVTATVNMVSCSNWSPSMSVSITSSFVPGDYLFKLISESGAQSYIPLTVTDPTSHAAFVVKNDVYTWQAWNPYGGYDYYAGRGQCPSGVYPICSRAREVSFDRPYGYANGAGDFMGSEYPFVRFVEQHGLDVTYITDVDLDTNPHLLDGHRALLSLGHDECWSYAERETAQQASAQGMNIAFFAASPMLRHVRPEPSPLGPERQLVDYRDSAADPLFHGGDAHLVTGNTWSDPPASWPEASFVGDDYGGFLEPAVPLEPLVVTDADTWIYQGTGLHNGSVVAGVLGSDFDEVDPATHPANLEVLAHSPIDPRLAQTQKRDPYSDMTYYTDPLTGAGVFDTGINTWIPDLTPCPKAPSPSCAQPIVDQMTLNLLVVFGAGPAGRTQPAKPNWQGRSRQPATLTAPARPIRSHRSHPKASAAL
jgi:hypothetical protein